MSVGKARGVVVEEEAKELTFMSLVGRKYFRFYKI